MAKVMKVITAELYDSLNSRSFNEREKCECESKMTEKENHEDSRLSIDCILESVNQHRKAKANRLVRFLERQQNFSWNDKGEIIVKNERCPFSSFIDLLSNGIFCILCIVFRQKVRLCFVF